MNGRGIKIRNEYAQVFGKLYDKTPKAVFAAVAFSLGARINEGAGVEMFIQEWQTLVDNQIVKQRPPK